MDFEPSERLRIFLRDSISGYEELEALVLLAREPGRAWTDGEVAMALNARLEPIASALERLAATAAMIECVEQAGLRRFRFAPSSPANREIADELMRLHSESRLTLVQLMSANALERVRGAAMRRLADAFRLERPKK